MPTRTMTCTANDRPEYLARMLESLSKNVVDGYLLVFQIEPGNEATAKVAEQVDFMPTNIRINDTRLGVRDNPFELLRHVFTELGSEGNVYLEDDIELAPDAIALANWFFEGPATDPQCLCQCFFNVESTREEVCKTDPREVWVFRGAKEEGKRGFSPLGWACTKEAWEQHLAPVWKESPLGWDFSVTDMLGRNEQLYVLNPGISRSTNIGREGGTYTKPEDWDRRFPKIVVNEDVLVPGNFLLWGALGELGVGDFDG